MDSGCLGFKGVSRGKGYFHFILRPAREAAFELQSLRLDHAMSMAHGIDTTAECSRERQSHSPLCACNAKVAKVVAIRTGASEVLGKEDGVAGCERAFRKSAMAG